jgi:hypothetical protein
VPRDVIEQSREFEDVECVGLDRHGDVPSSSRTMRLRTLPSTRPL